MKTTRLAANAACVSILVSMLCAASVSAQIVVFDDALQNGFDGPNYSYNGGTSFTATAFVHNGTKSVSFTGNADGSNGAAFAHPAGAFDTAQYPIIHFWINGGAQSGQDVHLNLQNGVNFIDSQPIASYIAGGSIAAGQWREVTINLTAAPFGYNGPYDRFDIVAGTNNMPTVYLDDISLQAGAASNLMTYDQAVILNGLNAERFSWFDSANKPRSAVLAYNDGTVGTNGARGGALTEFTYKVGANTRTVGATDYAGGAAYAGFGYIVNHARHPCGPDDSPLGGFLYDDRDSYERVWQGRHHAIFRYHLNYLRNCDAGGAVDPHTTPATIDWMFSTGRDNPVWAITYDLEHVTPEPARQPYSPVGTLFDDSRAPYGEMNIDGVGADPIDGVAWADRYKFTSTSTPLTVDSTWTWAAANTISPGIYGVPWVKEWMVANDATMGIVQTQTIDQQDAGGARDSSVGTDVRNFWGKTSANGNACGAHKMPCGDDFPYQSIGNSLSVNPTNNAHMTWKTQYGFLGQATYNANNFELPAGGGTTPPGFPRKSYSTYIVFGTHSSSPVETQVAYIEAMQFMTLTINNNTGSVIENGPAGINRPAGETVAYQPEGYNHIYGAIAFNATNNQLDVNIDIGGGKTLSKPLIIVGNFTTLTYPTVKLGGVTLAQDVDYYPSIRDGANEIWITLNRNLSGAGNHFEMIGGVGGGPAAPANVVATAVSTTQIDITWTAVAGATYEIDRKSPGSAYAQIDTSAINSYSDANRTPGTAYAYRVRAVTGGGTSLNSAADVATTILFTDPNLNGVVIQQVHLSQLRTAVDAVRALAATGAGGYTDAIGAGLRVKAVHINELRTALDNALNVLGAPTPGYLNVLAGGVLVRATDFQEIRDRLK